MNLTRRTFLKMAVAVPVVAAVPVLAREPYMASLTVDKNTFPKLGNNPLTARPNGNRMITIDEMTRQMLKVSHDQMVKAAHSKLGL